MNNYICINGAKIDLTEEQVKQILGAYGPQDKQLFEYEAGDTVKIGGFELVVLEHLTCGTAVILKDGYGEDSVFSDENNKFNGSYVDDKCQEFAQNLSEVVGWDNIILHEVDLTSDDGLKDYGTIERRASLITTEMYRKYVDILDTVNPKRWWWLATPHSTKRHENDSWVKCVSPAGHINYDYCLNVRGVRPFCILKSTIFVSD